MLVLDTCAHTKVTTYTWFYWFLVSLHRGWKSKSLLPSLPTQVEAEHGVSKKVLLHQALHNGGGPTSRNSGVRQTQDAIKLSIDKIRAGFSFTQAKLLAGNGEALNLMEEERHDEYQGKHII